MTAPPKLIHFICIDAMRFDCMNWHPDRRFLKALGQFTRLDTPNLDRLSKECVRFTRCLSPAGYTALSVPSTLTGTYARTHGIVDFTSTCLRPGVESLCSILKAAGYRVVLHSAKSGLIADLGLFDDADEILTSDQELIRLLAGRPPGRTFVYSHLNDLHAPYVWLEEGTSEDKAAGYDLYLRLMYNARRADRSEDPPAQFVRPDGSRLSLYQLRDLISGRSEAELTAQLQRQVSAYYHGCEKLDRLRLGPLLDGLAASDAWRSGLVIVYADHGEAQRPFAKWSIDHGATAEENLVRTPLMIRLPGQAPRLITDLVGLIDLCPTVLELVGENRALDELPYRINGRSLVPLLGGGRHDVPWYWIEGWNFTGTDVENPPCVKCRALRYADGRKYTLFGDLIRPEDYATLTDEAFMRYVAARTYGALPTEWLRNRITTMRQTHSRAAVVATFQKEVRQFRVCYDVDQDLLEERTQVLDEGSGRWAEYAAQLDKMLGLTAIPNLRCSATAEESGSVEQQLRALGYIA
jgi:hypothetical protein